MTYLCRRKSQVCQLLCKFFSRFCTVVRDIEKSFTLRHRQCKWKTLNWKTLLIRACNSLSLHKHTNLWRPSIILLVHTTDFCWKKKSRTFKIVNCSSGPIFYWHQMQTLLGFPIIYKNKILRLSLTVPWLWPLTTVFWDKTIVAYSSPAAILIHHHLVNHLRCDVRLCYILRESKTTRNVLWSRASVCLSVCVRGRMPTLLHGPGCNFREW